MNAKIMASSNTTTSMTLTHDDVMDVLNDNSLDALIKDLPLSSNKKSEKSETEPKIKFGVSFNKPNNWIPNEISFSEVDSYDFTKGFNEFIIGQKYVHLYFDFDSITSEEEFNEVYEWLEKLAEVFGPFSIGGYCSTDDMEAYGFRLYPEGGHYLSMHVVFYTTCISTQDLAAIMKHTTKKGYVMKGVHKLCDPNVYKIVPKKEGQVSRQVFRHVLSDKIYRPNDPQNKANHGFIIDDLKPSTQIVQIRGNERIITEDQWGTLFKPFETRMEQRAAEKEEKKKSTFDIDDFEVNEELIKFSHDDMQELLSHFEPTFENLMITLAPIRYGPFSYEFLYDNLVEWYGKGDHTNGVENVVAQMMNYHQREQTNRWFFSIIKHLDPDDKKDMLHKYVPSGIDFSIDMNNSKLTIESLYRKQYKKHEFTQLINDLRAVIGYSRGRWFIKEKKDNQIWIKEMSTTKFREEYSFYKPFHNNTKVTIYQIVSKFCNWFIYDDAKVSLHNQDNVINMFQDFKYKEIFTDDFSILEPFLNHIKTVICRNNDEKYNYFMKYFANIFQNLTVKNGVMLIIHGEQGSGKSFPIETFCELLGEHALANVDDLGKVFGKFNGLVKRHLLININETPEAGDSFKFMGQIKAKTTQKKTTVETKGIDAFEVDSWANYTLTTNSYLPIIEERGDRRLIYFETDNSRCGDKAYFDKLIKPIQPIKQGPYNETFMGTLLHYMRTQISVDNWDGEELIRKINSNTDVVYNEQLERQYMSLNQVEKWIVDNYKIAKVGIIPDDVKAGITDKYTKDGICKKLCAVAVGKRMCASVINKIFAENDINKVIDSRIRTSFYTLKPENEIPSLYAIIKYKQHMEAVLDMEEEAEDDIPIKDSV